MLQARLLLERSLSAAPTQVTMPQKIADNVREAHEPVIQLARLTTLMICIMGKLYRSDATRTGAGTTRTFSDIIHPVCGY